MEDYVCEKCKGSGRVVEKDGTVRPCWDCLLSGRLDVHSKRLPDNKIKI